MFALKEGYCAFDTNLLFVYIFKKEFGQLILHCFVDRNHVNKSFLNIL